MLGMKKLMQVGALVFGLLLPAQAMAAYEAHTRVDLNLRVGPDTTYGVIDVIPAGYPVLVLGCLAGYNWCDVEWDGLRGWVSASYLVRPGTSVYLPQWAPSVGLPTVAFSFDVYHDRHYRGRPWHRQRAGHWRHRHRASRPRHRQETREPRRHRREVQQPRRQRSEQRRERQRSEQRRDRRTEQRRERQRSEQRRDRRAEQRQRSRSEQRSRSRSSSRGQVYEQQSGSTPSHGRAAGN